MAHGPSCLQCGLTSAGNPGYALEGSVMSRLVNVSKRVVQPRGSVPPGGLTAGMLAAMRARDGLWFGWNGEATESGSESPDVVVRDGVTFASIKLPEALRERCYSGFTDGTLWPLFHCFLDSFHYCAREYE